MEIKKEVSITLTEEELVDLVARTYLNLTEDETYKLKSIYSYSGQYIFDVIPNSKGCDNEEY